MGTIITTTLTLTGLSAVFALLLTIADRTVGDYGEVTLTINDDKQFTIDGGDSLLSSLMEQEIFIPSACGGKGTCGYCKVQIDEGGGPVLQTEKGLLTEEDIENNIRLSCQCKVKEDMKIHIPEELFNITEFEAEVESIADLTSVIKQVRLKVPEGEELNFKAGQYMQLKAPLYDGNPEEVYRAYSISSSPEDKQHIELIIGYVPEGIATTYVHQHLEIGDHVTINGPYGDFYYQDNEREMILVAVGTGVAPILSILKMMESNDIKRKAKFYFGAKTEEDLFFLDYFAGLEEKLYDFEFVPCLSRVTEEDGWAGFCGRVNNAIDEFVEENIEQEAYLCGSDRMIESVVEALKKKGVEEDLIYYDKFD